MGERSGGGAIQPGGAGDVRDPASRSDPLPGDHAHDEQVWQDSGRGDRKWKGQKASGDLHQRHRRGTRGGADRAIDLSALGRGECHQGTVAQASSTTRRVTSERNWKSNRWWKTRSSGNERNSGRGWSVS